ncbi:hypothetical protein CE456_00200 (plasmid) [Aeromonas salmonicida]|nr:hypothetical protein CE456_00200 [Aeromonas salmonicida]
MGGNATGVQVQLYSPGGQQQQTVASEQMTHALTALLAWLQQMVAEGKLSPSAQTDLQANHAALQELGWLATLTDS